jgi:predicted membrane protein
MDMNAKSPSQSLLGLVIVGLGVGFLLDALQVWHFSAVIAVWWPALLILVGLLSLISNPRMMTWPLAIMAAGVLLLLKAHGLVTFNVWAVIWPVVLIFVGLSFLTDRLGDRPRESSEDSANLLVAFSGLDSIQKSDNFRGGKATALFGGIKIDLRHATIKDKATLETFVAFGGLEIIVPEGWRVTGNGLPLFGGWEDKTRKPSAKDAPVLHLQGTCLFGGVEVKN